MGAVTVQFVCVGEGGVCHHFIFFCSTKTTAHASNCYCTHVSVRTQFPLERAIGHRGIGGGLLIRTNTFLKSTKQYVRITWRYENLNIQLHLQFSNTNRLKYIFPLITSRNASIFGHWFLCVDVVRYIDRLSLRKRFRFTNHVTHISGFLRMGWKLRSAYIPKDKMIGPPSDFFVKPSTHD